MPRQRDSRRDEAFELWKQHKGEITNREIANRLDVPEKTISGWKSKDNWNGVLQTNKRSTPKRKTTKKKQGGQLGNKGNPNPTPKFPKRNKAAEKHGFFSKFLPEETLEIVEGITETIPMIDLLWQQITIQYAAIMRSQRIMFVRDQDDMTKELKKEKEFSSDSSGGTEVEYEIQFAWDKQATFLQAQSRAMSTLQSLIRQYEEMIRQGHVDEEQSLRIEKMKADIDKIKGNNKDEDSEEWIANLKAIANKRRQLKSGNHD